MVVLPLEEPEKPKPDNCDNPFGAYGKAGGVP